VKLRGSGKCSFHSNHLLAHREEKEEEEEGTLEASVFVYTTPS